MTIDNIDAANEIRVDYVASNYESLRRGIDTVERFIERYHIELDALVAALGLQHIDIRIDYALPGECLSTSQCKGINRPRECYTIEYNWKDDIISDDELRLSLIDFAFWLRQIWYVERGKYKYVPECAMTGTQHNRMWKDALTYILEEADVLHSFIDAGDLNRWLERRWPMI